MFFDIKWHDVPSFIAWFLAICSYQLLWLFSTPPVDLMYCFRYRREAMHSYQILRQRENDLAKNMSTEQVEQHIGRNRREAMNFYCFFFISSVVLFQLFRCHILCKMGFLLSLNFLDFLSDLIRHWIVFKTWNVSFYQTDNKFYCFLRSSTWIIYNLNFWLKHETFLTKFWDLFF